MNGKVKMLGMFFSVIFWLLGGFLMISSLKFINKFDTIARIAIGVGLVVLSLTIWREVKND